MFFLNSSNQLSIHGGWNNPCRWTDVIVKLKNGLYLQHPYSWFLRKKCLKRRKHCFCMLLLPFIKLSSNTYSQYTSAVPNCRGYLLLWTSTHVRQNSAFNMKTVIRLSQIHIWSSVVYKDEKLKFNSKTNTLKDSKRAKNHLTVWQMQTL